MSGSTFLGDQVLLGVGFAAARLQLRRLAGDGALADASEYAYGAGITGLVEAAGLAAAPSRLARMEPGDLGETEGCARLWLRWQAIGPDGAVFPALDADVTLTPAGAETTVLGVTGVYRLPGQVGAGLDPALARGFAAVTIRSLLARLACALMRPAGSAPPPRPPAPPAGHGPPAAIAAQAAACAVSPRDRR